MAHDKYHHMNVLSNMSSANIETQPMNVAAVSIFHNSWLCVHASLPLLYKISSISPLEHITFNQSDICVCL